MRLEEGSREREGGRIYASRAASINKATPPTTTSRIFSENNRGIIQFRKLNIKISFLQSFVYVFSHDWWIPIIFNLSFNYQIYHHCATAYFIFWHYWDFLISYKYISIAMLKEKNFVIGDRNISIFWYTTAFSCWKWKLLRKSISIFYMQYTFMLFLFATDHLIFIFFFFFFNIDNLEIRVLKFYLKI